MAIPDLLRQAREHHDAGRLDEAAALCERVLDGSPRHADALQLLGTVAFQLGDDRRAADALRRALSVDQGRAELHNLLGFVVQRRGKLRQAAKCFRKAIAIEPAPEFYNNLGLALKHQGLLDEAVEAYRQAIALAPDRASAHYNLGKAHRAADDLADAIACYRRALVLDPTFAYALAGLGEALNAQGEAHQAADRLREALKLLPNEPTVHCELGDALQTLGKLADAMDCYEQALELDPTLPRAWYAAGCAHARAKDHAAAIPHFERALDAAPDHFQAHHNLGQALYNLGQVDPALERFRRAAALGDAELPLASIALVIPGSPTADNQAVLDARRAWADRCLPPAPPQRSFDHLTSAAERPLRVGYVSAFFDSPNWMKPVWGLINAHDRARVEVHLFADDPESAVEHGYFWHPDDRFHDIRALDNPQAARLVAESRIDVLVDLNGYSRMSRLPLFALRPAPIVCGWFNMFATTGMACFDYLIGDRHVLPPDEERFYTERIARVPGCYLTFEVTYPVPDVAAPPCLSTGRITFGCLAAQYKLTTGVIEAWSGILHGSPGSRLVLKNSALGVARNREFVRRLFARFDVPPERVELDGPADHFEFLRKYDAIDLALDPFPYNGGTTTTEALWQGVPVLTFDGDRWASRTSATLLRNAGLADLVAPDLDAHVHQAIALATAPDTPEWLADLRRGMRARLRNSAACDTAGFARAMEGEYEAMWRRWRGGRDA